LIGFNRESLATRRNALLIATVVILQIVIVRVIADLLHLQGFPAIILNSALPLALGAVLLAQLVGFRVAVWSCVFTSLIAALQLEQWSFKVLVSGIIAGFVGAVLVRQARRRTHVFRAGLWIGVATFLTSTLFYLGTEVPYGYLAQIAAVSLLNGLGTAVFTSTILPLLEFLFGITTDISLLELSDLNHPLLKRLQIEAPGTFHHSLVVATLAEQAAAAIGANPLLARVCAYFHDIGKISQPEYFTENNMANGGRDAHHNLQPRMSSLIILNHVKEGLELAADYKLNKTLREAIAQHHGTSLIYYFYRRAVDQQTDNGKEDGEVGQQDYRYPGPRARKKEIVLIGLADACEAAVRAMEKPTPQKIQTLVDEIVMQRVQDGQLDEANLTFRDLAVAKDTLIKALSNMFHGRVPYPKDKDKNKPDEDQSTNPDANADADKSE
jgi:putative nucleotidyltransferase with HDIG domain